MLDNFVTIAWSLGGFIVALGALVAFHEYGHFWVARKLGVKVLRYSIGFGKPLWMRTAADGTEYAIASIPLGGYVRFLDQREGDVPEDERHLAFDTQPVWKRILIVAAGPGANLLLAVILAWAVLVLGSQERVPVLAPVAEGTIAWNAGLRGGEVIAQVRGQDVDSWASLHPALLNAAMSKSATVPVIARGDIEHTAQRTYTLDFSAASSDPEKLFSELGVVPGGPIVPATLAELNEGSPAQTAGFQPGDTVIAAAEAGAPPQTIETWRSLVTWLRARPGLAVELTVDRRGETLVLPVVLDSVEHDGQTYGQLGATVDQSGIQWEQYRTTVRHGPLAAIPLAFSQTWDWTQLTVRLIGKLFTGDVSLKNVSGPIQIAEVTGQAAQLGLVKFLTIAGIISISLGVLNLLPVPVLDGGHLLYYFVEILKGSPVSERVQLAGQQVGLVLLLMLMSLAFYNDIARLAS